jgi:hypothetical protein
VSNTHDAGTLAAYFQPVGDALWNDPDLGPVLRELAVSDPDLIAAVADVDRSQIRDALALTPEERLARATEAAAGLARYHRVG